jgi:hypothetical protein
MRLTRSLMKILAYFDEQRDPDPKEVEEKAD